MRKSTRPRIGTLELEQMLSVLDKCVSDGKDPPDEIREKRIPAVRKILAHDELRGHYGHCALHETLNLPHVDLWRRAIVLHDWISKWLGRRKTA